MNRIGVRLSRVLQSLSRTGSPVVTRILSGDSHSLMSRQLLLVSFMGRKTGRSYVRPVSYVRDGSDLLIPGGGKWWKNLGSGRVDVRLQGSWLQVTPEVVTEPKDISEALGRMMARSRAVSIFTGIGRDLDGRPEPEHLERELRRGFVVVRLHLPSEVAARAA